MTGEPLTATERWDAAMAAAVPHGPDEPCTCPGCWACAGRVVGCTCDIDWCAAAELRRDGRPNDPLEAAERELRQRREELGSVEHCADPGPALDAYLAAVVERNALRDGRP